MSQLASRPPAALTASTSSSRASRRPADPEAGRLHLDHDLQRVLAGDRRRIPADQLVTFKYEEMGVATLEDGLYVLEDKLKDPAFVDTMAKFVKAR